MINLLMLSFIFMQIKDQYYYLISPLQRMTYDK